MAIYGGKEFLVKLQREQGEEVITTDDLVGATPLVKNPDGTWGDDFAGKYNPQPYGDLVGAEEVEREFREGEGEHSLIVDHENAFPIEPHSLPEYMKKKWKEGNLPFIKSAMGLAMAKGEISIKEGLDFT